MLFFIVAGCSFFASTTLKTKVVVAVDGHHLTAQAFAQELAYRLRDQDALSAKDPKLLAIVKSRVVEDFIVKTLSEAWAKDKGMLVRAEDLEAEIVKVQSSYPDSLSFQQALAEQGISFRDWKARLQETLLQKVVSQTVIKDASAPTDADMQTYFREHTIDFTVRETAQIRQILVATESDATAIEAELKKGKK